MCPQIPVKWRWPWLRGQLLCGERFASAKRLPECVSGFIRGYTGINEANSVVLVQSSPRQPVEGHTRDTEQFPC